MIRRLKQRKHIDKTNWRQIINIDPEDRLKEGAETHCFGPQYESTKPELPEEQGSWEDLS